MSADEQQIINDLPIVYGEGDDEALPEDLYFRDITAKIKANTDGLDDIENLHENVPLAPPQARSRPEIVPEPHYAAPIQSSDPSDTLYGANTNTYTTDDNITYPNPSLTTTKLTKGSCGDSCGCDESQPIQPQQQKTGGCGESCDCDDNNTPKPPKKFSGGCGSDCGCDDGNDSTSNDENNKAKTSGGCGSDCGCDDSSTTTTTTSSSTTNNTNADPSSVQTFGNYADILKSSQNPQNVDAPIKASTVGADYDSSGVSNIPGLGVVWIKTWGCSHNTSDGEYMAGLLSQAGYTITNDELAAQIWICNSCSVKGPSEQSFFNELKRGRSLGKGVVVAGCVPQAHPNHPQLATFSGRAKAMSATQLKKLKRQKIVLEEKRAEMRAQGQTDEEITAYIDNEQKILKEQLLEQHKESTKAMINEGIDYLNNDNTEDLAPYAGVVSVLGTDNIHRVVEVVEATLQGNSLSFLSNPQRYRPANELSLPKIRKNPFVEIISINTGCLNNCTYCKTKHARGNLRSYPIDEIVERVRTSLAEGVIEIWLTSEDLGAYGIDIGVRVHNLVTEILKIMTPGTMLRMGMSNPPYFKDILEPMYSIFQHPACYEFLHIPVQAGADAVLNDMKRDYTNYEFQTICDELLKHVPTLTLATDFICGFPTETDDDWKLSVQLVEKYKFPVVFINQFYPRPGTPAYALPQLPAATLKARSKELVTLFNSYNTRIGREGEEWDVLVTDMSRDGDFMVAHTKRYDQVLIPAHPKIMGKKVRVRITQAEKHYFHAELLPNAVEDANKIPTLLPVNYKYWSFAKYIDSNLASFIQPETTTTTPNDSPITKQPIPIVKRNPNIQSSGIDDEDELSTMTKRTNKTPQSTTTTPTSTTPTSTTTIPQSTTKAVPNFANNPSRLAQDMVQNLRSIEDFEKLTDEEVQRYAELAARGAVPSDVIEDGDLDPQRSLVMGFIFILALILFIRRIY